VRAGDGVRRVAARGQVALGARRIGRNVVRGPCRRPGEGDRVMARAAITALRVIRVERRVGTRIIRRGVGARVHPEEGRRFMAARAGERRHGQMVDLCSGPGREVGGRVTALARGRGRADRDVGRRHAGRRHTVVAAGAVAGYTQVGEHRAAPAERRMAGIALQVGDDVRGPLALCLHAVVAGRAAAAHLGVVEVDRRVPGDRRMAAGALVGREDVVGGLGGGAHGGADAVTGAAIPRGALEHGVGVTGLAGQVAVLADELEAGRQMVEARAALRGMPL